MSGNDSLACASGVDAKVNLLTTELQDAQNEFANNTFTAGVYEIRAWLDWGATVPTVESLAKLYKNGASFASIAWASSVKYCIGSFCLKLNAGDTLELYANQNSSGASKNLSFAQLSVTKIS